MSSTCSPIEASYLNYAMAPSVQDHIACRMSGIDTDATARTERAARDARTRAESAQRSAQNASATADEALTAASAASSNALRAIQTADEARATSCDATCQQQIANLILADGAFRNGIRADVMSALPQDPEFQSTIAGHSALVQAVTATFQDVVPGLVEPIVNATFDTKLDALRARMATVETSMQEVGAAASRRQAAFDELVENNAAVTTRVQQLEHDISSELNQDSIAYNVALLRRRVEAAEEAATRTEASSIGTLPDNHTVMSWIEHEKKAVVDTFGDMGSFTTMKGYVDHKVGEVQSSSDALGTRVGPIPAGQTLTGYVDRKFGEVKSTTDSLGNLIGALPTGQTSMRGAIDALTTQLNTLGTTLGAVPTGYTSMGEAINGLDANNVKTNKNLALIGWNENSGKKVCLSDSGKNGNRQLGKGNNTWDVAEFHEASRLQDSHCYNMRLFNWEDKSITEASGSS